MKVTTVFQLMQWRAAIGAEQRGMRHSSGRSVKAHAARFFGLSPRAKADAVLARIEALIALAKANDVPLLGRIEIEIG